MSPDAATRAQIRAADPRSSSWVSANAGSGKTRVLTDRVARLLLRGTDPVAILCLTYTKAAAAEMQVRLFDRLGRWAMLPDDILRAEIAELGEASHVVERTGLARARTLFARALETPGGLKIQTIHAFCERLLRRFPVEAGVAPQFQVLDERQAAQIRLDLLDRLAADPDSGFDALAPFIQGQEATLDRFLQALGTYRAEFARPPDPDRLARELGVDFADPGLAAHLSRAISAPDLGALSRAFAEHDSPQIAGITRVLAGLAAGRPIVEAEIEAAYLTQSGQIRARLHTKAVLGAFPAADDLQQTIASLVLENFDRRQAKETHARSLALGRFAHVYLSAYGRAKAALGRLDFDDLIDTAHGLLVQSEAREWVRYRLDGGISHVLVDEAQDTAPGQWQVIDALTDDFFSGEARSPDPRTIFVVGDFKQSIYSFQGAAPQSFHDQRVRYANTLNEIGQVLEDCALDYSFRSAAPVLDTVDAVLAAHPGHGLGSGIRHLAHKSELPGRVEIWPFVEGDPADPDPPWDAPVDQLPARDPSRKLAEQIAGYVADLLSRNPVLPGREAPLDPADVLILVRSRNKVFSETIRALKAAGVPVAGADRLNVTEQLAVRDLLSLLRFIALREDDLSLAEVLRSPICDLSEADLFRLAHGRDGTLWAALLHAEGHDEVRDMLRRLRAQADFLRPFELLEKVLTQYSARPRIRARLGLEAEEAVDALLNLALDYERLEAPTLPGFLDWIATGETELKRQLDPQGGEVRVMTVHGAKGLEAPVVILPDTARREAARSTPPVTLLGPGAVALRPSKDAQPRAITRRLEVEAALAAEEDWRLLYVAMTRAEQWLIVCGGGKDDSARDGWYGKIETALDTLGATAGPDGVRSIARDWAPSAATLESADIPPAAPPSWLCQPVPARVPQAAVVAPSRLVAHESDGGGAGAGQEAALRRGRQIHMLLEHLPGLEPSIRHDTARRLLGAGEDAATPSELPVLLAEVDRILDAPDLAWIFGSGSRAEVPVAGRVAGWDGTGIHGIIDRLVIGDGTVWAIDFKSDAQVPSGAADIAPAYLAQLGAYATALTEIYPDTEIRTAILWTREARLMPVSHDDVNRWLQSPRSH